MSEIESTQKRETTIKENTPKKPSRLKLADSKPSYIYLVVLNSNQLSP